MAAVGLMAVTTSIPALAVNSATSAHTLDTTSSISQTTQTIEVGTVTTSAAIERDGYTVAEVPKIVPATSGKSTAVRGGTDSGQLSNQGWVLPVAGVISDPYGPRPNRPVAGVGDFHGGTDIAALCGTPVSAATGGTVTFAGSNGTYGNWILVDHGNGIQTGYAHNSTIRVDVGQNIAAGEIIAEVGNTGASSGCHLHFEIRVNDAQVDPEPFMSKRGITLG